MNKRFLPITALIATAAFSLSAIAPASADQAAVTRNTILGAAIVAGIVLGASTANANQFVGYDAYGRPIYANGYVGAPAPVYYSGGNGGYYNGARRDDGAYRNRDAGRDNDAYRNRGGDNRNNTRRPEDRAQR